MGNQNGARGMVWDGMRLGAASLHLICVLPLSWAMVRVGHLLDAVLDVLRLAGSIAAASSYDPATSTPLYTLVPNTETILHWAVQ
jgi:hypothetical protein